jgi:hypothetical protein
LVEERVLVRYGDMFDVPKRVLMEWRGHGCAVEEAI